MPVPAASSVAALQQSVSAHLTAIEFYRGAAIHLSRIGYPKLGERFSADADEESEHLKAVLGRLEYFWTPPELSHDDPAIPRDDVPNILRAALAMEIEAAGIEQAGIANSRAASDEGTAIILTQLLAGSEASIRRIEGDLFVITQIGIDNWLANHA